MNGILNPILVGSLAVVASWIFSGCRFGNNQGEVLSKNPTGLYEATPKSVLYSTNAKSGQFEGDVSGLPEIMKEHIADPVGLYAERSDLASVKALLFVPSEEVKSAMPIVVKPDNQILTKLGGTVKQFFDNENCGSEFGLEMEGRIDAYGGSATVNGVSVRGRIYADFLYTEALVEKVSGACATSRQLMHDCYVDASTCGGANEAQNEAIQANVVLFYKPYIDSGAMAVSDIPSVKEFEFQVKYE